MSDDLFEKREVVTFPKESFFTTERQLEVFKDITPSGRLKDFALSVVDFGNALEMHGFDPHDLAKVLLNLDDAFPEACDARSHSTSDLAYMIGDYFRYYADQKKVKPSSCLVDPALKYFTNDKDEPTRIGVNEKKDRERRLHAHNIRNYFLSKGVTGIGVEDAFGLLRKRADAQPGEEQYELDPAPHIDLNSLISRLCQTIPLGAKKEAKK